MFSKKIILTFTILLVSVFFRFYNLAWGYPFFFHPDENNIAYAITGMTKNGFNPHFFAYGSLPMYIVYAVSFLAGFGKVTFPSVIYTLRFFSALLSFLLIPSVWFIGTRLWNKQVGRIAAGLTALSTGLIQYAHFGTFEMWLTFFCVWFFYFCYRLAKNISIASLVPVSVICGLLVGTKISMLVLAPLPLVVVMYQYVITKHKRISRQSILTFCLLFIVISTFIYVVTNPFAIFSWQEAINSLHYESSVALGTLPVFYTQSFLHTTPVLFQLVKVYPFLLNPVLEIIFFPSFVFVVWMAFKTFKSSFVLLIVCFLFLFLSQAFLFVKWTRYIVPTLPFIYLFVAITIEQIFSLIDKKYFAMWSLCLGAIFAISFVFSFSYFATVYLQPDSRIIAASWLSSHSTGTSQSAIEQYDLGAVAFNPVTRGTLVDIYNLENNLPLQQGIQEILHTSTYFISPSQRLVSSRLSDPTDFPEGNKLYLSLLHGTSGFHVVYQTPCALLCTIAYLGNPLYLEGTASVFDHPIVSIYKQ